MTDDTKFNPDRLFRTFISFVMKNQNNGKSGAHEDAEIPTARELLNAVASWAGKGKDEVIQVLCREIGVATAAMLKEPLIQVVETQKLVVTIEFARKPERTEKKPPEPPSPRKKVRR